MSLPITNQPQNTPFDADDELRYKIDEYLSHFEVSIDGIGDVGLYDLVHPRIKDKHGHGVEWAIVIGDRIMEAVLVDRKNQIEAVLDRLEGRARGAFDYEADIEEYTEDVLTSIEAERNRLKETNYEQL